MKIIFIILLIVNYIYSSVDNLNKIVTKIKSVKKNNIFLEMKLSNINGYSGVVFHTYNNEFIGQIKRIIIKNNNIKILDNLEFNQYVPTPNRSIKKGDLVILGYHYNKAILLAPNKSKYEIITKKYKKNWIHPDRLVLFLKQNSIKNINIDSLSKFTIKNNIGLIYLLVKNKLIVFDSLTKQIIKIYPSLNILINNQSKLYTDYKFKNINKYKDIIKKFLLKKI